MDREKRKAAAFKKLKSQQSSTAELRPKKKQCKEVPRSMGAPNPCLVLVTIFLSYAHAYLTPLGSPQAIPGRLGLLCAAGGMQQTRMSRDYKKTGAEFDLLDGSDFDLLSFRSFKREALLKYSNLNQSEPLRILIFGFLTFLAVSYPAIASALQEPVTDVQRVEAAAVSIGSFLLFLRERGRRTAQLVRMDKECGIGDLELTTKDPMTGARKTFSVRDLRNKRRLLAYYGDKTYLAKALKEACIYRRRYTSSQMAVVAIPKDGSSRSDWELPAGADGQQGFWLWSVGSVKEWSEYFDTLLDGKGDQGLGSWIALNMRGRSCASGLGTPILDELLGSKMPPLDFPPEADAPMGEESVEKLIYARQGEFYRALTEGDLAAMVGLWGGDLDKSVSEFVELGGRLDPWESQLRDGSRPAGMQINSRDVIMLSDDEAASTCIEVPANSMGQTLMATQRWGKIEGEWKMLSHKTIPYSVNVGALAVLRCDKRGCVAGIREKDRANRNPFVLPMP